MTDHFKRNISRLVMGLAAISVICSCAAQPGNRPSSAPATVTDARGPGSGGGGGDFKPDDPATDDDVRSAIEEAKGLAPFVLNHLETVIVNARAAGTSKQLGSGAKGAERVPREVYAKMYPWPKSTDDVHERWLRARFNVEPVKPCYDGDGKERAASAFPFESDDICMSIPLIKANAKKGNVLQRIVALMIHELAHKAGVRDEDQAKLLEDVVKDGIPADPKRFLSKRVEALISQSHFERGGLAKRVRAALELVDGGAEWTKTCFEVSAIAEAASSLGQENKMDGYLLATLRPSLQAEEQAIRRRASVLAVYCADSAEKNELIATAFGRKSERDINMGETGVLSIARGVWRRPVFQDPVPLRAELSDILESLSLLKVGVERAERYVVHGRPAYSR